MPIGLNFEQISISGGTTGGSQHTTHIRHTQLSPSRRPSQLKDPLNLRLRFNKGPFTTPLASNSLPQPFSTTFKQGNAGLIKNTGTTKQ